MKMSKIESAIRIVMKFNEAFNCHDVAGMMQLISDNCIFENFTPAPDGTVYSGKEAITKFWENFFSELPNVRIEIEQIFSAGIRCVVRWKYNWMDTAGEKKHIRGASIFQVENDLICEIFFYVKG